MRKLFMLLWLLAGAALAQTTTPTADAWEARFRNSANTGVITYYIVPDGAVDQIATYNGSTNKPEYSKLGTGLSRAGNVLTIAPASTQIVDGTTTGRAVLTATDAAAARTAIGAGTSSFSGAYGDLTGTPTTLDGYGITDAVRSVTAGAGLSGGIITGAGTISLPSTGTAGSYSGVTTDAQGRVTTGTVRGFAYPTRALDTCFQVSATRDALVSYAVEITVQSTLASGQVGAVYLETFSDSGCTTGTQEIMRGKLGLTQALGLTVTLDGSSMATLHGVIPAGAYVKLRTENTTGTPTFTARPGQEVLL